MNILVTDSGLGGLSTLAELYRRGIAAPHGALRLIFANALADYTLGYNMMPTAAKKAAVFDNALAAMAARYHPATILIACNTLSVIYPQTVFAKSAAATVVGIVEAGIDMMLEFLCRQPEALIVILGTQTTIDSGEYPRRLIAAGVAEGHIVTEACGALMMEIEKDASGETTHALIRHHIGRAVAKLPRRDIPIGVSLNCTHYGYSEPLFWEAFRAEGIEPAAMLSPNARLAEQVRLPAPASADDPNASIAIEVVSQVRLDPQSIASTAALLEPIAPPVADALRSYTHIPDFFAWR